MRKVPLFEDAADKVYYIQIRGKGKYANTSSTSGTLKELAKGFKMGEDEVTDINHLVTKLNSIDRKLSKYFTYSLLPGAPKVKDDDDDDRYGDDASSKQYGDRTITNEAEKLFTIKYTRGKTGKEKDVTDTLPKLIEYFSYTLLTGNSYNSKIPKIPKTVKALVKALNDTVKETQSGSYNPDHYELGENPAASVTEAKFDTTKSYKLKEKSAERLIDFIKLHELARSFKVPIDPEVGYSSGATYSDMDILDQLTTAMNISEPFSSSFTGASLEKAFSKILNGSEPYYMKFLEQV